MVLTTPAGTRFKLPTDEFPYTVHVAHGLERFRASFFWAEKNFEKNTWRMYMNNSHYVFCFKQQDDQIRFTLACL